jgi:hypothetical protein
MDTVQKLVNVVELIEGTEAVGFDPQEAIRLLKRT